MFYIEKNNLQKKIILFFLFTALSCFVFAETKRSSNKQPEQNWSGTNSGDYVIYRDYSWKEESWVGFFYYNKNTIAAFLYTDKGKTFPQILFSFEEQDGEFVITGQNIVSAQNNSQNYIYAVNYLMQMLPKFHEWKEKPNTESLVIQKSSKSIFEEEYDGECIVNFSSYIPLFYIESILNAKQKFVLKIEEIGRAKSEESFFNFTPIKITKQKKQSKNKNDFVFKSDAKKNPVTINGLKLHLDSQWMQQTENSFLLGEKAFLSVVPVNLEKSAYKTADDAVSFIVKFLCSSGDNVKVMLNKTDITGSKEEFKIINSIYDVQTKTVTSGIHLVKKYEGLKYIIVSLSADFDFYQRHKKYFDNLF